MSEMVVTWILWAFISFTNPTWDSAQTLDEFPTNEDCITVAKGVALNVEKEMREQKIVNADVTLGCIPILQIVDPQNLNGSGLIKPKTKPRRYGLG